MKALPSFSITRRRSITGTAACFVTPPTQPLNSAARHLTASSTASSVQHQASSIKRPASSVQRPASSVLDFIQCAQTTLFILTHNKIVAFLLDFLQILFFDIPGHVLAIEARTIELP